MKKLSNIILALTALLVVGFLTLGGCNKKAALSPKVSDFCVSGCNGITLDTKEVRHEDWNDTIYVTAVDETKLKISTTNTPFFCGTDTIWHETIAQEQNISLSLLYEDSFADCICGYHVDLTIENLKSGQTYMVNIKKDGRNYFQFEVVFGPDTELMFVI